MPNKSSQSVIEAITTFAAEHRLIRGFTFWDIEQIKSDAGTEFTSQEFEQFCAEKRVAVSFAPPKHQEGNHFTERTWQYLRKLAQCMLVHARLPDMYLYHDCFMPAMCLTYCLLRISSLLMAQSLHLLNCLWDPSLRSATSEYLDVPVLLKSGQSQWMASLKTTAKVPREELGEYTLDFPQLRKDCYFMFLLPGR